jgi:hypothetical protein
VNPVPVQGAEERRRANMQVRLLGEGGVDNALDQKVNWKEISAD